MVMTSAQRRAMFAKTRQTLKVNREKYEKREISNKQYEKVWRKIEKKRLASY